MSGSLREALEQLRENDTPEAVLEWADRRDTLAARFENLMGTPRDRGETAEHVPLGATPRNLHDSSRCWELTGSIARILEQAERDCAYVKPDQWAYVAKWATELAHIAKGGAE